MGQDIQWRSNSSIIDFNDINLEYKCLKT